MLQIHPNTKIYVHCPAGIVTGGTELLHQLVDLLNNKGRDAYVIYQTEEHCSVPNAFQSYNIKVAQSIENDPSNILVLPEAVMNLTELLHKNDKIQIAFWWLSLDNYFGVHYSDGSLNDFYVWNKSKGYRMFFSRLKNLKLRGNFSIRKQLTSDRIVHLYQSEYAQHYLQKIGVPILAALKDYINTDYANTNESYISNKQDIVLYNPSKGFDFTKQLIAMAPHIEWKPIVNMTRDEVLEAIKISKIYIDFGNHPGKDRLPRECAINNCCIITGTEGAANFYEDIPIESQYKFNQHTANLSNIISLIENVFVNYDAHIMNFDYYRRRILGEKREFTEQAIELFNL